MLPIDWRSVRRARRIRRILTSCAATLALAAPAGAQDGGERPGPQSASVDIKAALERTLVHNRELAALGHRIAAQEGQVAQAALPPNPELGVVVEDAFGSGPFDGLDSAQTTLTLGWVLEGHVRRERVGAAEARASLVSAEARVLRVDVAADTAEHFLASLANQARLEAAERAIELGEQTVAAVTRRVRAGKAPTAELARAEAELATDRLLRDDATHELSKAYHRLAAQWGASEPDFSRVVGDVLALPEVEPYSVLTNALEGNPELARYATEERLSMARLRLAEARRWPTVRPHVGVRWLESTDDTALVAGLSLPLPLLDRRQGEVRETRASVNRARGDVRAARLRLRTTLFELHEEFEHHLHKAELLAVEVIPRLEEALAGTRRAYDRGRYGYFELRSVQAELLHARRERLEASAGAHRLVIALERLIGEPAVKR